MTLAGTLFAGELMISIVFRGAHTLLRFLAGGRSPVIPFSREPSGDKAEQK